MNNSQMSEIIIRIIIKIPTDYLISTRRPHLERINKKKENCLTVDFDDRVKLKESEKRERARELKKLWNMKVTVRYNWCTCNTHERIGKGTGGLRNKRTSGDHSNKGIDEIGQNAKKSLGDLKRLSVSQTPVVNHQLTMVIKNYQWVK